MKLTAIIPASGRGKRMGGDIPKQYMDLAGKPVLYYSLKAFEDSAIDEIVLVVSAGEEAFVREKIVDFYGFQKVKKIVPGGAERYLSVYEGLKAAADADYVFVHDAARPLISAELISSCIDAVRIYGACVPAVAVTDTIKVKGDDGYEAETLDRSRLAAIQTPQCFKREKLFAAYANLFKMSDSVQNITDDASVVEVGLGEHVRLIPGDSRNRKVTTPEDLIFAEALLKAQK